MSSVQWINQKFLLRRYSCSENCIIKWRRNLGFPDPVKMGVRKILWRLSDVVKWEKYRESLERQTISSKNKVYKRKWTKDKVWAEARKYNSKKDWRDKSPKSYDAASRYGWINEMSADADILSELERTKKIAAMAKKTELEKKEVLGFAQNFFCLEEWAELSPDSLNLAVNGGYLPEVEAKMKPVHKLFVRESGFKEVHAHIANLRNYCNIALQTDNLDKNWSSSPYCGDFAYEADQQMSAVFIFWLKEKAQAQTKNKHLIRKSALNRRRISSVSHIPTNLNR